MVNLPLGSEDLSWAVSNTPLSETPIYTTNSIKEIVVIKVAQKLMKNPVKVRNDGDYLKKVLHSYGLNLR